MSRSIADDLLESRHRQEPPMPWLFPDDAITQKPAPPEIPPIQPTRDQDSADEIEQLAEVLSAPPESDKEVPNPSQADSSPIATPSSSAISSSELDPPMESALSEQVDSDSAVSHPLTESSAIPESSSVQLPSPETTVEPKQFSSKRPNPSGEAMGSTSTNYRLPKVANWKMPKRQSASVPTRRPSEPDTLRTRPTNTATDWRTSDASNAVATTGSTEFKIPIWTYLIPLAFVWIAWQYCRRAEAEQEKRDVNSSAQVDCTSNQREEAAETKEVVPRDQKQKEVPTVASSKQVAVESVSETPRESEDRKSLIEELVSEQSELLEAREHSEPRIDSTATKKESASGVGNATDTAPAETDDKSIPRHLGDDSDEVDLEPAISSGETDRKAHFRAFDDEPPKLRDKLAGLVEEGTGSNDLPDGNEDDLTSLAQQLNLSTRAELDSDLPGVPTKFDDLTRLEGIDVVIQQALQNAGYYEYADLQKADPAELEFIVSNFDRNLRVNPSDWSRQAAFASRGDWSGLREYCRITRVSRAGESMQAPQHSSSQESSSQEAEDSLLEAANSMVQKFASLSQNENPKRESKKSQEQTTE